LHQKELCSQGNTTIQ